MVTVKIKGMSCQHCVGSVQKSLEDIPGISNVVVDLEKGEARYDGDVDLEIIEKVVTGIGFECVTN